MSTWRGSYLIAGIRLEIVSRTGDPSGFLPAPLGSFASPGPCDFTVCLEPDEGEEGDPLKRFFPPKFGLERAGDDMAFEGTNGRRRRLGTISPREGRGELGTPPLRGPWRIEEEREVVGEAVQAFVRACLQLVLLAAGGTLLHAAGLALEGDGYAFVGYTRAGKTTLVRDFPAAEVLGDDLVAVREACGAYRLYGSPWPGREGGGVDYGDVPLRAVFILHRELPPGLEAMSAPQAVAELASNAPRLGYAGEEGELLDLFSRISGGVPIYRLSFGLDFDVPSWLRDWRAEEGRGR